MGNDPLTELTRKLRDAVETRLAALMPPADQSPANLHCAMRYTLLAPGKRARALLAMLAAKDLGRDRDAAAAISPACALEMVHAASLILDDLPAMDNASLRRGLPANHMLFGEATAILAAIGLLNRAFGVIAEDASLGGGGAGPPRANIEPVGRFRRAGRRAGAGFEMVARRGHPAGRRACPRPQDRRAVFRRRRNGGGGRRRGRARSCG